MRLLFTCIVFLPLRTLFVTSPYGYRVHPLTGRIALHAGVDLRGRHDTVFAALDGFVDAAGYDHTLGIHLSTSYERVSCTYGHLSQVFVRPGDTVRAGEPIAVTGATGRVTGEHLHFAIKADGRCVDPLKFLYALLKQQDHE